MARVGTRRCTSNSGPPRGGWCAMNSPMRVVCSGCLRSIEVGSENGPVEENACPFCGYRIDSGASETASSEAQTRVPSHPRESETTDGHPTIDWADAWTRG